MSNITYINALSSFTNQSASINHSLTCQPKFQPEYIGAAVLLLIEVLWNFLILLGIWSSHQTLKHNFVYLFVANLVVANIVLGILTFYTYLVYLVPFEKTFDVDLTYRYNQDNSSQNAIMKWWAFRKALVAGLFHVMSLGVIGLIYGISSSAIFVSRKSGTDSDANLRENNTIEQNRRNTFKVKRSKALVIILMTWIIPIIYSLFALGWNCTSECDCLPGFYKHRDNCRARINSNKCSTIWHPMTNGHVLVANAMWLVQSIVMFVLLLSVIIKYRSSMKPSPTPKPKVLLPETEATYQSSNFETFRLHSLTEHSSRTSSSSNQKSPLHPTIKLLIAISASYTLCTAPLIMCFTIDSLNENPVVVSTLVTIICAAFFNIYCFICPVFLIIYMPGLRSAIVGMFLFCPCTTTTVTVMKTETENSHNQN